MAGLPDPAGAQRRPAALPRHATTPAPSRSARALYLDAPLLHLEFLTASHRATGENKVRRYDATAPHLRGARRRGPLAHRFYLPERYARARPGRRFPPRKPPRPPRAVSSEQRSAPVEPPTRSRWPRATVTSAAASCPRRRARASIEPFESRYVMAAGERRPLYFTFRNEGGDTWPWDPRGRARPCRPPTTGATPDGALLEPSGLRTAFPHAVRAGGVAARSPSWSTRRLARAATGSRWTPSRSTSAGSATR